MLYLFLHDSDVRSVEFRRILILLETISFIRHCDDGVVGDTVDTDEFSDSLAQVGGTARRRQAETNTGKSVRDDIGRGYFWGHAFRWIRQAQEL